MKKLIFPLVIALCFFSCGENNNNPITEKEYLVRYEATCTNPNLYQIQVVYAIGQVKSSTDTENIKTQITESPFSFEVKMKTGMIASLNVSPICKLENDPNENRNLTAKIYVNGKLTKESTSNIAVHISTPLIDD